MTSLYVFSGNVYNFMLLGWHLLVHDKILFLKIDLNVEFGKQTLKKV